MVYRSRPEPFSIMETPSQPKMTMGELKQRYGEVIQKCKTQKEKIDQLLQNQNALQEGLRQRDAAIESRELRIQECEKLNEESAARLQAANSQIAQFQTRVSQLEQTLADHTCAREALETEIASLKLGLQAPSHTPQLTSLSSEKDDLHDRLSTLTTEISRLKEDQVHRIDNEQRLSQTIQDLRAEVHHLNLERAVNSEGFDLDSELALKSEQILRLENDLRAAQAAADDLRRELNANQVEFERKDQESAQKLKRANDQGLELESKIAQTNSQHRAAIQRLTEQFEHEKAALQKALVEKSSGEEAHAKQLLRLRSQSEADRSQLENRITELESQLRIEKAERLKTATELDTLQEATSDHSKLVRRAAFLEQNYQEAAHAKTQLESQLKQLLAERHENQVKLAHAATISAQISRLEGDYAALKLQLMQSEVLCRSVTEERDKILVENEELSEKIRAFKQSEKLVQRDLADSRQQITKLKTDFQNSEHTKQLMQSELESVRKKVNEQLLSLRNQVEELELLNGDLVAKSNLTENEANTIKTTAEYRERELMAKIEQLQQTSDASVGQIARFKKYKKKSEIHQRELTQLVTQLEAEKAELQQKCEMLHKELQGQIGVSDAEIFPRYIRKVLLQFFLQDGSTREALIPVILSLVKCDEKVIQQAKRSWAESTQIISHAYSIFKT
jgi:chromosome segregation ATPase